MGVWAFNRPEVPKEISQRILLAAIAGFTLLTLTAGIILPQIISAGKYFQDPAFWSAAVGAPAFAALFWAAWRFPVARVAPIFVAVAFVDAWIFTVLIQGSGYLVGNYAYLTVIVLLAAFFLSARVTALYAGLNLAGVIVVSTVWGISTTDLALSVTYIILFSTLLVALAGLLREDQARLTDSNQQLTRSLHRHELVQEAARDVIINMDHDYRVTTLNPRAKELAPLVVGAPVDEGDLLTTYLTPVMMDILARLRRGVDADGVGTIEKTFDDLPGGRRSFRSSLVADGEGGFILFATDVTDQHVRWEQEMEQLYSEAEIKNLQDLQAMQKNFINMASHELQTPLTPLRLQSRLLRARASDYLKDVDLRAVEIIERNTERMAKLVEDILEVVRIGNGRLPIEMHEADVVKVCSIKVMDMLPAALEAGVKLELEAPDESHAIVDSIRIEQVLGNLISNAIKFSNPGGKVVVDLHDDPQEIHIDVRDQGAGMDPEEIEGLYEPFTQFHQDVVARTGTGLGLTICKGIMEAHRGSIHVHSDGRGKGTTVTITFPRTPSEPPQDLAPPDEKELKP